MDASYARYDVLVHALYEAALRPAAWGHFFAELSRAINVPAIHLLALEKHQGLMTYIDGHNLPASVRMGYLQQGARNHPWVSLLSRNAVGQWLHSYERCSNDVVASDSFSQDLPTPNDLRHVAGCKLLDDDAACAFLSVLRGRDQAPLDEEETAFLDRLTPHLQRAAQVQSHRYVASASSRIGHALVNKLRQPLALLRPDGAVVSINDACRRLLETTSLLRSAQGSLRMPEPFQRQFAEGCAAMAARLGPEGGASTGYRSMQVASPDFPGNGSDVLYAFYTMLLLEPLGDAHASEPLMLVLFHHPATAAPLDAELLAQTFDLTPSELRVSRMLAGGCTVKEIAARAGVQHDTVRKQLQSIYRKTTTSRQADLIRLMLQLPSNAFLA